MNSRLITKSPAEGLQVSLQAMKSLVSDYHLRCRQAEEMCNLLMSDKIPSEVFEATIVNRLKDHMSARGLERSTHYLGVIQTTLMALTNIQRSFTTLSQSELEQELTTIIQALTVAANPS